VAPPAAALERLGLVVEGARGGGLERRVERGDHPEAAVAEAHAGALGLELHHAHEVARRAEHSVVAGHAHRRGLGLRGLRARHEPLLGHEVEDQSRRSRLRSGWRDGS
jgi:hypothetical protein